MAEWNELHPTVQKALASIGVDASEVSQAVGNAAASAGYHHAEGTIAGHPFSSCLDLRVSAGWTPKFKSRLIAAGGAPFFRGPETGMTPHCHVVWVGLRDAAGAVTIKPGPRMQIIDFIRGYDGLVGHRPYTGPLAPTAAERERIRQAYEAWAPHVRTKVFRANGEWLPCYAFLEQDKGQVRCEARALLTALGADVHQDDGLQAVYKGKSLDLSGANLTLEGEFTRGSVRGLAEAVGLSVLKFAWMDAVKSACQVTIG